MIRNRVKTFFLTALVLALIICVAILILLYISKNTYSGEKLALLGNDIMMNQNSNIYHVSVVTQVGFDKLLIGIDDIDDYKIEAFKKDYPNLPYKKIELRDSKKVPRHVAT